MCKALISNGQGVCFVLNNYWICILFMFYEINILVIFKFLCYLLIMNIIHWCLQYGVCLVFLEMFLYSSWFVHEPSSCMYLLQRETYFSALSVSHGAFFSLSSSFLEYFTFIFACVLGGGVRRGLSDKCAVLRACLFIHLQQLTDSYEFDLNFMLMKAA